MTGQHALNAVTRPIEQHGDEILAFADFILPRFELGDAVIEIGVRHGGTSELWTRLLPAGLVLGIDRIGHDSYQEPEFTQRYRAMELELPNYQFLRGDSHSEETADRVREIVGHIPVGLLFIDGDHAYEGVKRDWELYSPLVKPGGWIAFHDIVDGPRTGGGVTRLFRELQTQYVGRSFILAEGSDWGGIGAVTIP